jgi:hypothetical protein
MQAAAAQANVTKNHTSTTIVSENMPNKGSAANQNSLTHLSMEIVRMGSPFFGN